MSVAGASDERDPPDATRHRVGRRCRCGHGQPGLADTDFTHERDEAMGGESLTDRRELVTASDERADRRRQVAGGGGARIQGWEDLQQARVGQLPDPLAAVEALQPVQAEVEQLEWGVESLTNGVSGVGRQQDLPSVSARPDPGASDDREADVVVLVAENRVARVQRHAHSKLGDDGAQ